jgi:hypothetical protein
LLVYAIIKYFVVKFKGLVKPLTGVKLGFVCRNIRTMTREAIHNG